MAIFLEPRNDISVRAGFPPVILSPVNFEAIYQAQRDPLAAPAAEPAVQLITPVSH